MNHPTTYTTPVEHYLRRYDRVETTWTITAGEARACLDAAAADRPTVPWKCNPSITRGEAAVFLRRALPADDAAPVNHLIARNVLRLTLDVRRVPERPC